MDTGTWITILIAVAGLAATAVGILFVWLRNSIIRLDQKIDNHFLHLDKKIEWSQRDNYEEIRDVRSQVQGVIKMVADNKNCKAKTA